MEELGVIMFLSLLIGVGYWVGYEDTYEFDHRIEPTKIKINQTTNDTTFVYIME